MKKKLNTSLDDPYDIIVIGGGITGIWCALEARLRGYKTLLIEKDEFAKFTSARSTKLIHGGLRYLQSFQFGLVSEALKEREILIRNAPSFVKIIPFIVPISSFWKRIYYKIGLSLYDLLSFNRKTKNHHWLARKDLYKTLPNLTHKFIGGYVYYDGQFDDIKLPLALLNAYQNRGGEAIKHTEVTQFIKEKQKIVGVKVVDKETEKIIKIKSNLTINATGPFTDKIRRMDDCDRKRILRPSKGIHLYLDQKFLSDTYSLIIPKTTDGRVIFAIPYNNKLLVGTTDTYTLHPTKEPIVLEEEIDFLLETLSPYLTKKPNREDVLSTFAGIRPLIAKRNSKNTTKTSRKHKIYISSSNLITLAGGKWTTARRMAEDTINAIERYFKQPKTYSKSKDLEI